MTATRRISPQLAFWTDNPTLAQRAVAAGVDWVGPDLEHEGKPLRQPDSAAWISTHRIDCLPLLAPVVPSQHRFARCNGPTFAIAGEIDALIQHGVACIMLPMAGTLDDIKAVLACVRGRVRLIVMIEQASLLDCLDELLALDGIDAFYIGCNDLSRSLGYRTRFGCIADGTVTRLAACLASRGLRYGFLGIARDDALFDVPPPVSPRVAVAAMVHLGASLFLFSRSFEAERPGLPQRVAAVRQRLLELHAQPAAALAGAHRQLLAQCAAAERE